MPEQSNPKLRLAPAPPPIEAQEPGCDYAELDVTSNFSFLRGASHPDELVYRAAELGYRAIAITDVNSLAGVVRAYDAAKELSRQGGRSPKLIVGARLTLDDGPDLLVWPADRAAYGRLCRLLTLGKRRVEKGDCAMRLEDLAQHSQGLLAAIVHDPSDHGRAARATRVQVPPPYAILRDMLGDRLSLASNCIYGADDRGWLEELVALSRAAGIPLLAGNNVHYHVPERRILQDVLTCIRHGCTIHDAGFRLFPNGERYLKSPAQMRRLFADHPQAIRRGLEIAEQCAFSLAELRYEYPCEIVPAGKTPVEYLADLAWAGAAVRYPGGIPAKVRQQIEHELTLIEQLKIESYFLTVYDIVQFARSRGILCQGRGSAANSAVCYCIGITAVDPARVDLLFERFVSAARGEPPDIDVDFEHERREEVLQYIYTKYGRDRAGMTAEVISYRGRSAVRDVGKALGLSLDLVDQMAKKLEGWSRGVLSEQNIRELGLDPSDRTVRQVVDITGQIMGFPRHLSQHVGGMIMTRGPLCELVPIENAAMQDRTVIEWDKDDIDTLGILKVDVLGLGMLTCISKCLAMVNDLVARAACPCWWDHTGKMPVLQLHNIPPEDPAVYDMMSDADTIGVFQVESRAQMSMLPRLRPRCFYDLVIEVAIMRPGPIQGNMVHPYLRRRNGQEPVSYPSEAMRGVLQKTLGVPLFQEQAMKLVMVGAGFSAEDADRLRRAMAAWRKNGAIDTFRQKIIDGMLKNGYTPEFAEQCFLQIRGFGEYGFPESHAASFALLVYVSAWLKHYYPAAFCASLLNSQPMGFYAPAQIVRDACEHGVDVRAVDVNSSEWDCTMEERTAHESTRITRIRDVGSVEQPPMAQLSRRASSAVLRTGPPATGRSAEPPRDPMAIPGPSERRFYGPYMSLSSDSCDSCRFVGSSLPAVRLGFRQVKGLRAAYGQQIVAGRKPGPFTSIAQFWRRTGLPRSALRRLAEADAFASLGLSRRQAIWQVMALHDEDLPLFDHLDHAVSHSALSTQHSALPLMPLGQEVKTDYCTTGLSLRLHPVALVRPQLEELGIVTAEQLRAIPHGQWARVAGLVLIRQRPGTAKGIVFETLEDETGIVSLIIRPNIYEKYGNAARQAGLLHAEGYVERQGQILHLMTWRLYDRSELLAGVQFTSRDFH